MELWAIVLPIWIAIAIGIAWDSKQRGAKTWQSAILGFGGLIMGIPFLLIWLVARPRRV